MNNSTDIHTNAAVENPPAATTLTPEAIVEQLRTLRSQMGDITPLTPAQRRALRHVKTTSNDILQASINVIDAADVIAQAVGQPAAEVRDQFEEANRWTAVEDELRLMLNGIVGANLMRRQQVAVVSSRAYLIGAQLARDPAHAVLVPHVQEIKRMKRLARRKKAQTTDAPPAPTPGAETSQSPKQ